MKQEKIRKARKLVWLLLLIIPLITAGVTYFMVTSKNTEIDNAILSAENQRVQTEEDMQQLTEDRKQAEQEHKEKQKEVSEQEDKLQDMKDERKNRMETLEKNVITMRKKSLRDDINTTTAALEEAKQNKDDERVSVLQGELDSLQAEFDGLKESCKGEKMRESLIVDMAEIDTDIQKAGQIEDEELKKKTQLELQKQLDKENEYVAEYDDLEYMLKAISTQNDKLESLKSEEQEQQDELKQMQTDLDNMEASIAQLKENAENLDVSRPVMQTYMIYAVSISIGGSLLIILLIQLILGSMLKKAVNSPTLPPVNAEEPKSENEITQ